MILTNWQDRPGVMILKKLLSYWIFIKQNYQYRQDVLRECLKNWRTSILKANTK